MWEAVRMYMVEMGRYTDTDTGKLKHNKRFGNRNRL